MSLITDNVAKPAPLPRSVSVQENTAKTRCNKKELAKLGMTVCLGVLVATGMCRSRSSRRWHVIAGTALVGLSVWHHLLYLSSTRENP